MLHSCHNREKAWLRITSKARFREMKDGDGGVRRERRTGHKFISS